MGGVRTPRSSELIFYFSLRIQVQVLQRTIVNFEILEYMNDLTVEVTTNLE